MFTFCNGDHIAWLDIDPSSFTPCTLTRLSDVFNQISPWSADIVQSVNRQLCRALLQHIVSELLK